MLRHPLVINILPWPVLGMNKCYKSYNILSVNDGVLMVTFYFLDAITTPPDAPNIFRQSEIFEIL